MKNLQYFYNGRSTLNFILETLNIDRDKKILYPEFTCDVLFQYRNRKYKYDFYSTNKDFSINFNLLKKKITKQTKVIILINFFGILQNTKKIYNFCKKKGIYLIIDDCHTYYNPKLKLNSCCDFKFFSPGKLFPKLDYGGILVTYNKDISFKKEVKTCEKQFSKSKFKYLIKSTIFYKTIKNFKKRPQYENPYCFKSKYIVKNCILNKIDKKKIENLDYKTQNLISHENFKFWVKISNQLKIKPLISFNDVKHGIPLYFVAKCKNKHDAQKIFDLGWKNNIEITSWPTLNRKMIKNRLLIDYWNKLVFFPNIHRIKFNNKKISWKI